MTDPLMLSWLRETIGTVKEAAMKAAAADGRFGGRAHWSSRYGTIITDAGDPDWAVLDLSPCVTDDSVGAHIALNDPASVIARCEADLAILDEHGSTDYGYGLRCRTCFDKGDGRPSRFPCRTVRLVAAGYRHHPGYAEAGWPA